MALGEAVLGLGVNTRVLMIGAHPDDEDTNLIAWLSRGRQVTTAYLSLTHGDGGQNVIGNELGEALGVLRTEELLAARRVDGALQYFTRAYDFGFSKDTADTYAHWPKDTILGDVVRIVRAFRPHVIVAVFSGTPRDGHGQHQVSGILAREAYDAAADIARFSVRDFGAAWATPKFYRAARGNAQGGTLGMDVGAYSPLRGESYGEIAGRSRSQHKSQGFGALERKGPVMNYVRREATRVNEASPATSEHSMFDGIDTTWARFRAGVSDATGRAALDALPAAFLAVRRAWDPFRPAAMLPPMASALELLGRLCSGMIDRPCANAPGRDPMVEADLAMSVSLAMWRLARAMSAASGVSIDAIVARELVPVGAPARVDISLFNQGPDTIAVAGPLARQMTGMSQPRFVAPGAVLRDSTTIRLDSITQPWWLVQGRSGGTFVRPGSAAPATADPGAFVAYMLSRPGGEAISLVAPVEFRYADDVRGEIRHAVSATPAITITLGERRLYARANVASDRELAVRVRSADTASREVRVSLRLPAGLRADSVVRTVSLPGYGAERTITYRVSGRLAHGSHTIAAVAESGAERFDVGYDLLDYEHVRRQRIYRPAAVEIEAVDVQVPAALRVAYVPGVSDNVAAPLTALGIPITVIPAAEIARADLSRFTTVVVGPRAYDAHPALVAANSKLLDFARNGGTLVVQYGQYEMTQPGIMPYPITINRPHDRVTHEDAPVRFLDAGARELTWPNRISQADFSGWVQERSLYMPRTFDANYRALLAMSDPGEQANNGAILVAPLGKGKYVYTSLAFFRQLPAGVPGAARLFVNLLSAGLPATTR